MDAGSGNTGDLRRPLRGLVGEIRCQSVEAHRVLVEEGAVVKILGQQHVAERHPVDRKRMAVRRSGGKEALTEYWLEKRYGPPLKPIASLVAAKLGTGRTHQVRVHLAISSCPVVGDRVCFGENAPAPSTVGVGRSFPRQALHAAVLEFKHPRTGRIMRFATELPQDFKMFGPLS